MTHGRARASFQRITPVKRTPQAASRSPVEKHATWTGGLAKGVGPQMNKQSPHVQPRSPRQTLSRRQALKLMGVGAGMATLAACIAPNVAPEALEVGATVPAVAGAPFVFIHRQEYFPELEEIFVDAVREWGLEHDLVVEEEAAAVEYDLFVATLMGQIESGSPPDLVYHRSRLVELLYLQNVLEPLNEIVEQTTALYGQPTAPLQRELLKDEHWYGIPFVMSGSGKFARRSLVEAAGYDPEAVLTYDQLRAAALAASDPAAEVYGWGMGIAANFDGSDMVMRLLHAWGASITDADVTHITFNSPETIAAVSWLADVYTQPAYAAMVPPDLLAWGNTSNNEYYVAGKCAITHNYASVYAEAKVSHPNIFEDSILLPTVVGPTGEALEGGSGGTFVVPRGAPNAEAAKQVTLHMLLPEIFLPLSVFSSGLFLPAYAGYYEMEAEISAFEADPNVARMGRQVLGDYSGLSHPAAPSSFFGAVAARLPLTTVMRRVIADGVSPGVAVAEAADEMAQIAADLAVFG